MNSPQRTAQTVEDEIIELRKELDRGGHEAGAATIAAHLQQRHGPDAAVPAVSTIWRILSARGFVTPQPHKRPKSSWQRFAADQPNERWQLDITHYRLADGREVEILNIIDDHSRLCVASTARRVFTAREVNTVFTAATSEYGDPAGLLSDNGAVFTGAPRRGGRVALELTCHARGIRFTHSRPYHPQTCGKVERFHQTVKKWLDRQPRPATIGQHYKPCSTNSAATTTPSDPTAPSAAAPRCRPTPARPKAVPTGTPIDTGHYRVRHDRIDPSGVITLRHNSRLHHIGLGRRHASTRVLVLVRDLPHPRPEHRRKTAARTATRPHPGLPTPSPTVNDVPRHLCTVSRDITTSLPAGFEPATYPALHGVRPDWHVERSGRYGQHMNPCVAQGCDGIGSESPLGHRSWWVFTNQAAECGDAQTPGRGICEHQS